MSTIKLYLAGRRGRFYPERDVSWACTKNPCHSCQYMAVQTLLGPTKDPTHRSFRSYSASQQNLLAILTVPTFPDHRCFVCGTPVPIDLLKRPDDNRVGLLVKRGGQYFLPRVLYSAANGDDYAQALLSIERQKQVVALQVKSSRLAKHGHTMSIWREEGWRSESHGQILTIRRQDRWRCADQNGVTNSRFRLQNNKVLPLERIGARAGAWTFYTYDLVERPRCLCAYLKSPQHAI